jgi:hypothetical protein
MYGDRKWVSISHHPKKVDQWIATKTFFGHHKIINQNLLVALCMVIKNRFNHHMKGVNPNVKKEFHVSVLMNVTTMLKWTMLRDKNL